MSGVRSLGRWWAKETATSCCHTTLALCLAAALASCDRQPSRASPISTPLLVELEEDSLSYVARPNGFLYHADGRFYISDAARGEVSVYDRGGQRVAHFGSKGKGPGELEFPASLAVVDDSTLAVLDFAASRVALFDIGSRRFREFLPLPSRFWTMSGGKDLLVGGAIDVQHGTSAALVATGSGAPPRRMGPVPALFRRVPATSAIFGQMDAIVDGDSLLTAFEVSDALFVTSLSAGTTDSVLVPVVRRRGVRHELLDRIVSQDPEVAQAAVYQSSMPIKLGVLSHGVVGLVVLDPERATGRVKGRMWLSLVDPARRRTCPDVPLDLPIDPMPRVDFRGDTLAALVQSMAEDKSVTTSVRLFPLQPAHCAWR